MTSRDFCFWLQGYFEIGRAAMTIPVPAPPMTAEQSAVIERHLALVFLHEIDPSMGPAEQQEKLNAAHGGAGPTCTGKCHCGGWCASVGKHPGECLCLRHRQIPSGPAVPPAIRC